MADNGFFEQVYQMVEQIPRGRVATYGQIARLAGSPRRARYVGFALHRNPRPGVIPCPYAMTGGTDAKHFSSICDNVIRFAPLEIDDQQYGSIHGIDENISISTLKGGVEFYKLIVKSF